VKVCVVVVTVIIELFPGTTEGGLNVAVAPGGSPETVKVTGLGKTPPTAIVVITNIAAPPAGTVCGGVGLMSLKPTTGTVIAAEAPPPGDGLNTVTDWLPKFAMSDAGTVAVTSVGLTSVVTRAAPFHSTTVAASKFVPVTVSVNAGPPTIAEVIEREPSDGNG
jgi:hypothetical protein